MPKGDASLAACQPRTVADSQVSPNGGTQLLLAAVARSPAFPLKKLTEVLAGLIVDYL